MTMEPRRQSWPIKGKAFTLIELLVVVAIVAVLASLLMPSLQNAKEKSKAAQCLGNMRQIYLGLMAYADDHDGWFPYVYWGAPNMFDGAQNDVCWDYTGATWMPHYLPDQRILWCPGMDMRLTDPQYWFTSSYYQKPGVFCSTYHIMAATSDRVLSCPSETANFAGWWTYAYPFAPDGQYRAPCPNLNYPNTWVIPSPCYLYGQIWIAPAAEQAAVVDGFDSGGTWQPYIGGDFTPVRALNNHWRLGGENIVFIDGHGEWRTAAQVKQRFVYYGANWIWW